MARTAGSHSEITGPRVREVALRLFAGQGYAAVSMRQIAAEVGVQAGALYQYAPDKQSMLFGLMRDHMERLLAAWAAEPKGGDALEGLEAFVRFALRYQLDNAASVQLCALEYRSLDAENRVAIDDLRGRWEGALETILRRGHAEKLFTFADPRIVTKALIAMLSGVAAWYSEDAKLSRERIERIYCNLARKAVGA